MHVRRRLAIVTALVLGAALVTPAVPGTAASDPVTQQTISQIGALTKAKLARSATERKVDSRLLAEIAMRSGKPVADGIKSVDTGLAVTKGQVSVDLEGGLTNTVLNRVRAGGGSVQKSQLKVGTARVALPLGQVLSTAALPQVSHIFPADEAMTASMDRPRGPDTAVAGPSTRKRAPTLSAELRSVLAAPLATAQAAPPGGAGSVVSEAVKVEAVDKARNKFGVSGFGVTVGVLSDGVDSLADSQATGDLPADVEVLPDQEGDGDEGTAMLELVHDIAPGAHLAFATAFTSATSFADNIRALRAAGADIIVDDVLYFAESPFQDGPIAQAVNDVTADGALYFSSAGNEGNKDDGTSGTWEGDFAASGPPLPIIGTLHDFAPGPGVQTSNPISNNSVLDPIDLFWSDPLGAASSDYDIYVVDENGKVVGFSTNVQDGTQDPYEAMRVPLGQQLSVVVVKAKGADRFLHLDVLDGRFVDQPTAGLTAYSTDGELRGHAATAQAFATAAAPAAHPWSGTLEPGDPPNPAGPFPRAFTAGQQSERYTSDGPRRVFFDADGTPITPGNVSSTGGAVRQKPEITAADGVSVSVSGFNPFFGTSAAAPNAAAIAALLLSGSPGISPTAARAAILASALDIEAPGTDRDTGAGILMADRLLNLAGATPQPYVVAGSPVLGTSTDGDEFLEPGETAPLNIPVTSIGDAGARQVRVTLSTPTAGVTITPPSRGYSWVAKDATKLSPKPWTISLSSSYPVGRSVDLSANVAFLGAMSPTSADLSVPTGQPDATVHDFAYTGPPVDIPDDDETGATVPITVSGVGPLSKAVFSIDGTTCTSVEDATTVGISHTFVSDLVGSLTSPSGTIVTVFAFDVFNGGHNFCQTVFDDSATKPIADGLVADAPFTGTWRPTQPLSTFIGEGGDGTWQFHVVDEAPADTGTIRSVSLHLSGFVAGT